MITYFVCRAATCWRKGTLRRAPSKIECKKFTLFFANSLNNPNFAP